ncbi:BspA family leucine-rich repeat surface protein [Lactobacillus sp. R2/2]|nr:BspA family leucine-rich repeat surface protein [Lactobacillus sp. R2/2]
MPNLDTENVTSMYGWFDGCKSLTSLDLSHFDTSNVTNMSYMFDKCSSLTSITFSDKFKADQTTDMSYMFEGCQNLSNIDLSTFKITIRNKTDMSYMFKDCKSLTKFDFPNFSCNGDASYMFEGCDNLEYLNLLNFTTKDEFDNGEEFDRATCYSMLKDLPKLKVIVLGRYTHIKQSDFNTEGTWVNMGIPQGVGQPQKGSIQLSSTDLTQKYANMDNDFGKALYQDTYINFKNLGKGITIQYRDKDGNKIPGVDDDIQFGNIDDFLVNNDPYTAFKPQEKFTDSSGNEYDFDNLAKINNSTVNYNAVKFTSNDQTITFFYTKKLIVLSLPMVQTLPMALIPLMVRTLPTALIPLMVQTLPMAPILLMVQTLPMALTPVILVLLFQVLGKVCLFSFILILVN